jgi:hypothetical protein
MMSNRPPTSCRESNRKGTSELDLLTEYEPDEERAARALLLIIGLPAEEIERIIGEITLESPHEM